MIFAGTFTAVIVIQPDFGSAFVLSLIIFGMWLCGEMQWKHLGGLVVAAIPTAIAAFLTQPYRVRRLFAFLSDDPELRLREGFQLEQSLIAIGSGGWAGLGLGEGIQKHHYLFAGHTDFIFAIIAEELGFIRLSMVIMAYAALVGLGWWVALNTSDFFGSLLATGITLMIFLGAAVHMGVSLGMLPTKGLVLPLISYGGSSVLVTLSAMGILINIATRQFALLEPPAPVTRRRQVRRF
jgi:cell division protein FtsW